MRPQFYISTVTEYDEIIIGRAIALQEARFFIDNLIPSLSTNVTHLTIRSNETLEVVYVRLPNGNWQEIGASVTEEYRRSLIGGTP